MQHKRTHTCEKLLTFDQCPTLFYLHDTLMHHRRIHTGEKPFPCVQNSVLQNKHVCSSSLVLLLFSRLIPVRFHVFSCNPSSCCPTIKGQNMRIESSPRGNCV